MIKFSDIPRSCNNCEYYREKGRWHCKAPIAKGERGPNIVRKYEAMCESYDWKWWRLSSEIRALIELLSKYPNYKLVVKFGRSEIASHCKCGSCREYVEYDDPVMVSELDIDDEKKQIVIDLD